MIARGTSSGTDFGWLVMLAVAIYLLYVWSKEHKRRRDLSKALMALSFVPLRSENQIPFGWYQRGVFKGGYEGIYNGCHAFVVESEFGDGDSSYRQTFVFVERPEATPWRAAPIISSIGLEYTQDGRWLIGTIRQQTIGPDAVVGYLQCFT